ncbi:hypothetical protein QM277_07205 [Acinetobacter baumannii]|nr:hypothetical protein [Acinetobacter baumannii]MDI9703109.1 hypothetical protein [Acinetobacter baumannii]MDI9807236.1 hypothetical protein [Acinetobacter baumannii]
MHKSELMFYALVLLAVAVIGSDAYRIFVLKQCVYTCQSKGTSHE